MRLIRSFLILLVLAGCEAPGPAPIRDVRPPRPEPRQAAKPPQVESSTDQKQEGQHVVQKGDTLFAIAFQNGLDYRDLAFWNNLPSPDVIKVGQVLRLTPPDDSAGRARGVVTVPLREASLPNPKLITDSPLFTEPKAERLPYSEANWAAMNSGSGTDSAKTVQTAQATSASGQTVANNSAIVQKSSSQQDDQDGWRWPADGALLGTFSQGGGKGVDIAGERQSPVIAAAPGKVVYSGNGLRGYGKLLIVKHSGEFLTAYAHNQALMVKEGDWVKAGQKIAEMGDTDSDRVKLHFEIRQYGKPLDPLKYLPERK